MVRPKKIKSPEDFGKEFEKLKITKPTPYDNTPCGNPYIEERDAEEDKQTIPTEKKYSPEVEAVGKAMEAFCQNPNKETEKELFEKSRELGRAIGGGITIFGDRETTEKVVAKLGNEVTDENVEKSPLEELQELEKKLRACTTETPRDIRYATFSGEEFDLHIEYNNITIIASMKDECSKFFAGRKCFNIECKKSYLATAQKMHEVLKEWRGE